MKELRLKAILFLLALLSLGGASEPQQTYRTGKILKWDTEPYSQSAHIVRNGVVYYIQVDKTVYQVTHRTTKPDTNLVVGQQVQCRVERDSLFIPGDRGKEQKYKILGASTSE